MPTRTAYPGTISAGNTITAANNNRIPGGWIGYAEGTTSQTGITTATDVTGCSVTLTPNSSRRLKITGQILAQASGSAARAILLILQDGTQVGPAGQQRMETTASAGQCTVRTSAIITPTNASHTYKLQAQAGTGTINVASDTQTAWILVEDIGPAT